MTTDDVRTLLEAFRQIFTEFEHDREQTEADQLRLVVFGIWYSTGSDAAYAVQKRQEADEALVSKRLQGLSPARIRELLASKSAIPTVDHEARTGDAV